MAHCNVIRIDELIEQAVTQLLLKEPFFAHLIVHLSREVSNRTETIALEKNNEGYNLIVNRAYFQETLSSADERVAAIKHEALHFVFQHPFRGEKFENQEVYNLASDLVVNQYIQPWPCIPNAVSIEVLNESGIYMQRDEKVEYYYDELIKLLEEDPENDQRQAVEDALSNLQNNGDHQFWTNRKPDETEQNNHDRLLNQAAQRAKDWSNLPQPLQDLINAMIERQQPQVDWRRTLRLFAASAGRTRVSHTMKRRSKRFGVRPGTRIKRFSKLAIALDTSGSVSDAELSIFFSEIHSIWRQGTSVVIIECDMFVQRSYPYRGSTPENVAGRGGTEFDPVFEYLNDHRHEQFDGCIYLTDGYACTPEIRPPCKLLWVICSDGTDEYVNFGPAIQLQD